MKTVETVKNVKVIKDNVTVGQFISKEKNNINKDITVTRINNDNTVNAIIIN